jgi:hypothetical protein
MVGRENSAYTPRKPGSGERGLGCSSSGCISREHYSELEPGQELWSLYDAGCRHVQMDDTNLAYLRAAVAEAARRLPGLAPFDGA